MGIDVNEGGGEGGGVVGLGNCRLTKAAPTLVELMSGAYEIVWEVPEF